MIARDYKRRPVRRIRSGATVVEAAIVLPIAMMLILGIFEFSRLLMTQNILDNAARNTCRKAVVHTNDWTTTQLVDYADGQIPDASKLHNWVKTTNIKIYKCDKDGVRIGSANDPDTWLNSGFNEYIAVEIKGTYRPIMPVPWFGSNTLNVEAFCMMYSEAN